LAPLPCLVRPWPTSAPWRCAAAAKSVRFVEGTAPPAPFLTPAGSVSAPATIPGVVRKSSDGHGNAWAITQSHGRPAAVGSALWRSIVQQPLVTPRRESSRGHKND